jgi:hypothetical protein
LHLSHTLLSAAEAEIAEKTSNKVDAIVTGCRIMPP